MKAGLQAKCKNRSVACEKCTNERPCWDCCQRCVCWDCDERQLIQSPVEDLAASLTSKIVERLGPLEYYRQQSLLGTTLGRRLQRSSLATKASWGAFPTLLAICFSDVLCSLNNRRLLVARVVASRVPSTRRTILESPGLQWIDEILLHRSTDCQRG